MQQKYKDTNTKVQNNIIYICRKRALQLQKLISEPLSLVQHSDYWSYYATTNIIVSFLEWI